MLRIDGASGSNMLRFATDSVGRPFDDDSLLAVFLYVLRVRVVPDISLAVADQPSTPHVSAPH